MKKKIWDLYAPVYKRAMKADQHIYDFMYERIPGMIRNREVLEIATGPGLLAKHVAPAAKHMTATDYSTGMIAEAKKGECPANLTFEVADAMHLPYDNDSFDAVLIANALHIVPDPQQVLHEIDRVLRPGGLLIAPGAFKSGNFAAFVTNFAFYAVFSAIVSTSLAKILFAASSMMLASTALGRIEQVMSAPVLEVTDNPLAPENNGIEFRDVSFTYEGSRLPALDRVSFRVEPGQTVALVGPSGGGKTTAASLIPRFWDVSSGSVEVGGVDVRQMDPHVLMDQVAFVFQNSRLFKASILENVRASRPGASREEVQAALAAAQCGDILEKLPDGMDTVIGTEGTYLSTGEQQRVALARAILKDAPIVVLDEATAFADPENESLIQKAFSVLTKDRTVIMIAHRLSTVTGADRIIVLDEGHVAEQGTHEELIRAGGLYSRMWAEYNQAVKWRISAAGEVN